MLRKNKTIGSRIASVGFALSLLLSMFGDMDNLFVRAGETAEIQ